MWSIVFNSEVLGVSGNMCFLEDIRNNNNQWSKWPMSLTDLVTVTDVTVPSKKTILF